MNDWGRRGGATCMRDCRARGRQGMSAPFLYFELTTSEPPDGRVRVHESTCHRRMRVSSAPMSWTGCWPRAMRHGCSTSAPVPEPRRRHCEYVLGDLLEPVDINAAARGCDVIIHLAAAADVGLVAKDPTGFEALNSRGTLNVLEAARATGARVVYASTIWVYSDVRATEVDEDSELGLPTHLYTATKLAGEMYCRSYGELYDVPGRRSCAWGSPTARVPARPPCCRSSSTRRWPATRSRSPATGCRRAASSTSRISPRASCARCAPAAAGRVYNLVGEEETTVPRHRRGGEGGGVGDVPIVHTPGSRGGLRRCDGVPASGPPPSSTGVRQTSFAEGVRALRRVARRGDAATRAALRRGLARRARAREPRRRPPLPTAAGRRRAWPAPGRSPPRPVGGQADSLALIVYGLPHDARSACSPTRCTPWSSSPWLAVVATAVDALDAGQGRRLADRRRRRRTAHPAQPTGRAGHAPAQPAAARARAGPGPGSCCCGRQRPARRARARRAGRALMATRRHATPTTSGSRSGSTSAIARACTSCGTGSSTQTAGASGELAEGPFEAAWEAHNEAGPRSPPRAGPAARWPRCEWARECAGARSSWPSNTFMATPLAVLARGRDGRSSATAGATTCASRWRRPSGLIDAHDPAAVFPRPHRRAHRLRAPRRSPRCAGTAGCPAHRGLRACSRRGVERACRPGAYGDAGIYSMYATKTVSTGEGGVLVSRHPDLVEFARGFRNYGKPATAAGAELPHERVHGGDRARADRAPARDRRVEDELARDRCSTPGSPGSSRAARRDGLRPLQVHRLRLGWSARPGASTTSPAIASWARATTCPTATGWRRTTPARRCTTAPARSRLRPRRRAVRGVQLLEDERQRGGRLLPGARRRSSGRRRGAARRRLRRPCGSRGRRSRRRRVRRPVAPPGRPQQRRPSAAAGLGERERREDPVRRAV